MTTRKQVETRGMKNNFGFNQAKRKPFKEKGRTEMRRRNNIGVACLFAALLWTFTAGAASVNTPADAEAYDLAEDITYTSKYADFPKGLEVLSEEQITEFRKSSPKIIKVLPNKRAFKRINKKMTKYGYLPFDEVVFGSNPKDHLITTNNIDSSDTSMDELLEEGLPLPDSVDNSQMPEFPPIRHQLLLGSCVSFAVTYYQLTHMAGIQEQWDFGKYNFNTKFSPSWTYFFLNDGRNIGTNFPDTYGILEKHGAVKLSEHPYIGNENIFPWCLDTQAWEDALRFRTNPVEYIDMSNPDTGLQTIKEILTNGYVLVFGTNISSWVYNTISDDPAISEDDAFVGQETAAYADGALGPHAMTIVGYNDLLWIDINQNGSIDTGEKGALKVANSWGTGYGNDGFMWLSYDSIRDNSSVPNGPDQVSTIINDTLYFLTLKPDYAPKVIAEFTLSALRRHQIRLSLGIDDTSQMAPSTEWVSNVIQAQGGSYAFDGTTTEIPGTFVLDFTDIVPSSSSEMRYFLGIYDFIRKNPTTLYDYAVVDLFGGTEVYSTNVPRVSDKRKVFDYVDYTYFDGNFSPVAIISAFPLTGMEPLFVDFNAFASYDPDGYIVSYEWNFGDGYGTSGITASNTYAAGSYTAQLTVTDDLGKISTDTVVITVESDSPSIDAPSNLIAAVSQNTVMLSWTDNSNNEDGFCIDRRVNNPSVWEFLGDVSVNVTTYVDQNVPKGRYYYRVQAYNASTVSDFSNVVGVNVK